MKLIANYFCNDRLLVNKVLLDIQILIDRGQNTGEYRIKENAQDEHKGRVDILGRVDRVDAAIADRGHNGEAVVEGKNVAVHFGQGVSVSQAQPRRLAADLRKHVPNARENVQQNHGQE